MIQRDDKSTDTHASSMYGEEYVSVAYTLEPSEDVPRVQYVNPTMVGVFLIVGSAAAIGGTAISLLFK